MRVKAFSIILLLCFSVAVGNPSVRVESRDSLTGTDYLLVLDESGYQRFIVSLPYETVSLEKPESLSDGYVFHGFCRFSEYGEPYPFSLRTNSYGKPIQYDYGDLNFIPVFPLHTMKEISTEFVKFEWRVLFPGLLKSFSLWIGKEKDKLSRIDTDIKDPFLEIDVEKYRLDGLYYWRIDGITTTGSIIESPLFSFSYKPSALAFSRIAEENVRYERLMKQTHMILSALASQTQEFSEAITKSETRLIGKIDDLNASITQPDYTFTEYIKERLLSLGDKQEKIIGILSPSATVLVADLAENTTVCVQRIRESERFLSETQKESILGKLYAYSVSSEAYHPDVFFVYYDLLCSLPPLKQLSKINDFIMIEKENKKSWLFKWDEDSVKQFANCISLLVEYFSKEAPFCFAPYYQSLEEITQFFLNSMIELPEQRFIMDPVDILLFTSGQNSAIRAKYFLDFQSLERKLKTSQTSTQYNNILIGFCNSMEIPYGNLVAMNFLFNVYSANKLRSGGFEDLYVKTTAIATFVESSVNELTKKFGTVFGYTLGWWELVWADINNSNPNNNLKKSYNAFKILFEEPVIVDATPTALEKLNNLRVTLIGNPTGQATETYELHEDYTVEAAYGFLKTIEYIYEKKQNGSYDGQISAYREALIRYLYKKGKFTSADDFVKKVQSYAFETPVDETSNENSFLTIVGPIAKEISEAKANK